MIVQSMNNDQEYGLVLSTIHKYIYIDVDPKVAMIHLLSIPHIRFVKVVLLTVK